MRLDATAASRPSPDRCRAPRHRATRPARTSHSQVCAARRFRSSTTFSAACTTAMPVAKVTRLPPVEPEKPMEVVSATVARTRSIGKAEHFGRHHRHRGARAADVRVAGDDGDAAVLVDVHRGRGFAADVEPEADGDAARLVRAQRRRIVRMRLDAPPAYRRSRRRGTVGAVDRLAPSFTALRMRMSIGSMPSLLREIVDRAFDGEGGHRRAGRAIGGDLRPVADHVVGRRARGSRHRSRRRPSCAPRFAGEPGKAPAW